eukprot:Pgem_evm1s16312
MNFSFSFAISCIILGAQSHPVMIMKEETMGNHKMYNQVMMDDIPTINTGKIKKMHVMRKKMEEKDGKAHDMLKMMMDDEMNDETDENDDEEVVEAEVTLGAGEHLMVSEMGDHDMASVMMDGDMKLAKGVHNMNADMMDPNKKDSHIMMNEMMSI